MSSETGAVTHTKTTTPFTLQPGDGFKRNVSNVPRIKIGRNEQVSISDSYHLPARSLPLSLNQPPSLSSHLPSPTHNSLLFHFVVPLSSRYKTLCLQPIPLSSWYTSLSYFTCQLYWSAQLLQDLHTVLTQFLVMTWHGFVFVKVCVWERKRKSGRGLLTVKSLTSLNIDCLCALLCICPFSLQDPVHCGFRFRLADPQGCASIKAPQTGVRYSQ